MVTYFRPPFLLSQSQVRSRMWLNLALIALDYISATDHEMLLSIQSEIVQHFPVRAFFGVDVQKTWLIDKITLVWDQLKWYWTLFRITKILKSASRREILIKFHGLIIQLFITISSAVCAYISVVARPSERNREKKYTTLVSQEVLIKSCSLLGGWKRAACLVFWGCNNGPLA